MTREEDHDYGFIDGYASSIPESSDDEETNDLIRSERSLGSSLRDDPNEAIEAYEEAVALERKIMEQVNSVTNRRKLKLSQVEHLERQVARIKASAKLIKEERKRIEKEVKENVDSILNDTNEQDYTIKCKHCKRQMHTSMSLLFMLNNEIWGSYTWWLCDNYGNKEEGSPVYESLAAIMNAHGRKTYHVRQCVYCYKEAAIEKAKRNYESTKQEHDSLRVELQQLADRTNSSTTRLKKLKEELIPRIRRRMDAYQDQVEAYRSAAITMESLRYEAIIDYEAVQYGPSNSWRSSRSR